MAKKVRKIYREGDRTTFYLKKGFPEEMLDWINGQSDIQLLFEYALDHLFQEAGPVDIASILPRTYEIGQQTKSIGSGKVIETQEVTKKETLPLKEEQSNTVSPEPSFSDEQSKTLSEVATTIEQEEHSSTPLEEELEETVEEIITEEENQHEESESIPPKQPNADNETSKPKKGWGGLSSFDDSGYM
ncbi:hypothetical protein ACFYKX_25300 [Cytobacillus sp. FJAT-54145]|uniref:Uncharacterized protein n=1 Tax=Cytobacillus spartinae TaxID=3299023 RepID=A0ABW6KMC9_9BACI